MEKMIFSLFLVLGLFVSHGACEAGDLADKDKVAAKVNDSALKRSDLITRLMSKHGHAVLENMIVEEIIILELKKRKLKAVGEKEIDLYIKRFVRQLQLTQGSHANIRTFLKNKNITMLNFRTKLRREIGMQRILGSAIVVTEKEMRDHYENYKSVYVEPPAKQVINLTIFHRNSPAPTDLRNDISRNDALALAQKERDKWAKDLGYIDELWVQKKYFIRGLKKRFGVPLKMKDKKNFIEVFKTPFNQISPVIEDSNGFQIYKVVKDLKGRTVPFEEVQSQIHDKLKAEKVIKSLQSGTFKKIRSKYKIQRLLNLKENK